MSTRASRAGREQLRLRVASACEYGTVVGFKSCQAGFEQFTSRDNHNVEAGRDLVTTENLSYQSFGEISLDGVAQFFCRRDSQATRCLVVGQDEERAVATANPGAALVDLFEVRAMPDPFVPPKARIGFQLSAHSFQPALTADNCQLNAIRC